MRLLVYAYAKVGSWTIPLEDGKHKISFPWQSAHNYIEEVTQLFLLMSKSGALGWDEELHLSWLRWRDELVRKHMSRRINEGLTGGEALKEAWETNRFKWDMADAMPASATPTTLSVEDDGATDSAAHPPPPPAAHPAKRQKADRQKGSGGASGAGWPRKHDGNWLTLLNPPSHPKGICPKFNGKVGCKDGCGVASCVCSARWARRSLRRQTPRGLRAQGLGTAPLPGLVGTGGGRRVPYEPAEVGHRIQCASRSYVS